MYSERYLTDKIKLNYKLILFLVLIILIDYNNNYEL